MDVTRFDYELAFTEFVRDLNRCEFCAVDQEMTGVDLPGFSAPTGVSPGKVYHAKRVAVEAFNAFQIGIAIFIKSDSGSYEVRPYNFYLLNDSGDLRLNLSAISFLSKNHMNFQKWLTSGIPYCNKEQEATYQENDASLFMDEDERQIADVFIREIDEWLSTDSLSLTKDLCCTTNFAQRLRSFIEHREDSHILVSYSGKPWLAQKIKFTLTKQSTSEWRGDSEKKRVRREREETRQLGFRKFWKALVQARKPIVGHNFMQDVMFMIHMHEKTLPEDYTEFKMILQDLLPVIYDTKTMATKLTGDSAFLITHLQSLYWECRRRAGFSPEEFSTHYHLPLGFHSYNDSTVKLQNKAHEAAYDAYMTGIVFSLLSKLYPDVLNNTKNVISAFGSAYFCCVNTEDQIVNSNTFILKTAKPCTCETIEQLFFATEDATTQSAVATQNNIGLLSYKINGLETARGTNKYSSYCIQLKYDTELDGLQNRLKSLKNSELPADINVDLSILESVSLQKL